MYKMKDGTKVKDQRLGRLKQFDERSKNFPIMAGLEAKKPRSYTWRCKLALDQGPNGSCVGFGFGHELVSRPSEVLEMTDKYAKQEIYWNAQKIDQWEGGAYPGANPFYEGTSCLAGAKAAQKLGWFESYRWAFSLEDLIMGVGYNGPAVIGTYWFEDMFEPDSRGYITPTGDSYGGHCTLVRAVSIKKKRLTIRNSWGSMWGNGGDCYISFDDMGKLLDLDGEALFCLKRHRIPQPK